MHSKSLMCAQYFFYILCPEKVVIYFVKTVNNKIEVTYFFIYIVDSAEYHISGIDQMNVIFNKTKNN